MPHGGTNEIAASGAKGRIDSRWRKFTIRLLASRIPESCKSAHVVDKPDAYARTTAIDTMVGPGIHVGFIPSTDPGACGFWRGAAITEDSEWAAVAPPLVGDGRRVSRSRAIDITPISCPTSWGRRITRDRVGDWKYWAGGRRIHDERGAPRPREYRPDVRLFRPA